MPTLAESSTVATSRRRESWLVAILLLIQAGLLGYSATRHSPTDLEPALLAAGISHWELGRFELYRVNPPLVRMVAAIPVMAVGGRTDWSQFHDNPGSRAEFPVGQDFVKANGLNSIRLFMYARWACIPFSLVGAFFAYRWAKELYGGNAGLMTLALYVFEPNLLAHGELITPDAACSAFGLLAGYTFWRWLKQPTWTRTLLAGGSLGLAELSKMSWLILFGLWPVLWLTWRWLTPRVPRQPSDAGSAVRTASFVQLATIVLVAIYAINLGYVFDGTGTPLKEFAFVSSPLSGQTTGSPGNRFRDTWLGEVRLPLPRQYLLGLDTQKRDFESYHVRSYLRGELKQGGWWYYYIYGLLVKVPCGTWGLFALVVMIRLLGIRPVPIRDELVLVVPAIALLVLVSSQTEFNTHLRYVFPSLGLATVFLGQAALLKYHESPLRCVLTSGLLVYTMLSSAVAYPHHLAYFNDFVGGSRYGYRHLLGSSLDWGQDILFLQSYMQKTGCVVTELQGSYAGPEVVKVLLPHLGSSTIHGERVRIISPNVIISGKNRFPPQGEMITSTSWVVSESVNIKSGY